jgi:hypothetical protein
MNESRVPNNRDSRFGQRAEVLSSFSRDERSRITRKRRAIEIIEQPTKRESEMSRQLIKASVAEFKFLSRFASSLRRSFAVIKRTIEFESLNAERTD